MFKWMWMGAALSAVTMLSTQAMAVTGGGAIIPYKLYKGSADSLMPANFDYTATGSGDGKIAFLTNDPMKLGKTTGSVDFAASESLLTEQEYNTYNVTYRKLYGPIIQIPSLYTPVVIGYKRSGINNLNLTSAQLCDALSGAKTTWGQLLGTNDTTAIRVVYSGLSSGGTEILTRHLARNCPTQFMVNTVFTQSIRYFSQAPANWVSVGLNQDVASVVNAVDGSIGYGGPDDFDAENNAVVARINGVLPTPANTVVAVGTVSSPPKEAEIPFFWVASHGSITRGYQIAGFSNLIIGQCYKDPVVANDLRNFLAAHYASPGNVTSPVAHGFIRMTDSWKKAINANFITNSSGNNLDINNPSVCNGIGRP